MLEHDYPPCAVFGAKFSLGPLLFGAPLARAVVLLNAYRQATGHSDHNALGEFLQTLRSFFLYAV
jgi:hypothetical protein